MTCCRTTRRKTPSPCYLEGTLKSIRNSDIPFTEITVFNFLQSEPDSREQTAALHRARFMGIHYREGTNFTVTDNGLTVFRTAMLDYQPDWILFLEDDVLVHPRIMTLVRGWISTHPAEDFCSLFNVFGLSQACHIPGDKFWGTQGCLFSRKAAEKIILEPSQHPHFDIHLGRVIPPMKLWVHVPSLVQHTGKESGLTPGQAEIVAADFGG